MRIDARVEVKDFLPRDGEVRKALSAAIRKAAFDVEGRAKVNAPVDTGALRNSIQAKAEAGALEAEVVTGIEYAIHQEFGTGRMAAQPFMIPAADAVRPDFEKAVAAVLRQLGRR